MAIKRVAHTQAVIDLKIKGADEGIAKVEQLGKVVDKVQDDNIIKYIVELDEKGAVKARKLKEELNAGGKEVIRFDVDNEYFNKAIEKLPEKAKTELQKVKALFETILNGVGKDSSGNFENIIKQYEEQISKLYQLVAEVDKLNKKLSSLEIDNLQSAAENYYSKKGKKSKEDAARLYSAFNVFKDQYALDDDGNVVDIDEEIIKNFKITVTINGKPVEKGYQEILDDIYKIEDKYAEDIKFEGITIDFDEDFDQKSDNLENKLDQLQNKLNNLLNSSNKLSQQLIDTSKIEIKEHSKDEDGSKVIKTDVEDVLKQLSSGDPVPIKIKPANINEFFSEIESRRAKLKIDIANAGDLVKALNQNYYSDLYDQFFKEYQGRNEKGNKAGKKKDLELKTTTSIAHRARDILKNAKGYELSDDELTELLALGNLYRDKQVAAADSNKRLKLDTSYIDTNTQIFESILKEYGYEVERVRTQLRDLAQQINVKFVQGVPFAQKKRDKIKTGSEKENYDMYQRIEQAITGYSDLESDDISKKITNMLKDAQRKGLYGQQGIEELISLLNAYKQKTGEENVQIEDFLKNANLKNIKDAAPRYKEFEAIYEKELAEDIAERKKDLEESKKAAAARKKEREKEKEQQERAAKKAESEAIVENNQENLEKEVHTNLDGVDAELELFVSEDEIASLKEKIEKGLNPIDIQLGNVKEIKVTDADISNKISSSKKNDNDAAVDSAALTNIISLYQEIYNLQEKVNLGNYNLAKTFDSNEKLNNSLIAKADIRNNSTTKRSIEELFRQYNKINKDKDISKKDKESQLSSLKDTMTAYVASYKDINSLSDTLGKKYPHIWSIIRTEVEKSERSLQAFNVLQQKSVELFSNLEKLTGKTLTKDEKNGFNAALKDGTGLKYLNDIISPAKQVVKDDTEAIGVKLNLVDGQISELKARIEAGINPIDIKLNADKIAIQSIQSIKQSLANVGKDSDVKIDILGVEDIKGSIKTIKSSISTISSDLKTEFTGVGASIKTELETADTAIKDLVASIKTIGETFKKATKTIGGSSKTQAKNIESVKTATENLNKELLRTIEIGDLNQDSALDVKLEEIRKEKEALLKQQEELNKQQEELNKEKEEFNKQKKGSKDDENPSEDKKEDDSSKKNETVKKQAKSVVDSYNKVLKDLDVDNLISNKVIDENDTKLSDKIEELKKDGNLLKQALETGGLSDEELKNKVESLKNIVNQIKELNVAENQILASGGKKINEILLDTPLFDSDKNNIVDIIKDKYLSQYEKILSDPVFKQSRNPQKGTVTAKVLDDGQIRKVTYSLEEHGKVAGQTAVSVRELTNVEGEYIGQGGKWVSGLKSKISNLTQYVTGIELVMRAWNEAREGFNFVKELNTSMTTIYQTMDITTDGLEELSTKAIQAAKNLGAVSDQMIDSINIYAAYGKTVDEIINQATPTVMLANAAGSSAEEASDYIQAVIQQYEELEGKETSIVNTYEKIAANVQIDFDKGIQSISEGVQTAGSVMNEAGVDFETYAASLAKVAEKTRLEGSQIGNAMKTIASRISRSKSGDEDVTAEERSNASKAYASVGIDVYEDDGSYRGLATILDELAAKWDTLTDAQKNYIAEQSAGVRNINIFNSMLDTWDEAKGLAADANEDTDYYLEVQEKWMDSMQAKLNTLSATMEEFWYNLIDTGAVNLIIDALTGIVQACEMVVEAFKTVGSVFGETGGSIGGIAGVAAIVTSVASAWDSFTQPIATGDGKTKRGGFKQLIVDAITGLDDLGSAAYVVGDDFVKAFSKAGGGMAGLSSGMKAVVGALGAGKVALLGFGAALAAIGIGIAMFDGLTDSTEETKEAVEKLTEAYEQNQSKLKNYKETTDSISKEFATLSEGVNLNTNENISLTTDEYSRYLEIVNEIATMYPSIVKSYDAQGNAILTLEGDIRKLNEAYEEYRLNAAKENLGDKQADGSYENLNTYRENLKNVTGQRSAGTKAWDIFSSDMFGYAEIGGKVTSGEVVDALEEIQSMTYAEVRDWLEKNKNSDIYSWLSDPSNLGLTTDTIQKTYDGDGNYHEYTIAGTSEEEWKEMQQTIVSLINETNTEVLEASNNLRNGLQSYLVELEFGKFKGVDESVFNQVSSMISLMSSDLLRELSATDGALESYVENLVNKLSNSSRAQLSLNNILNLGNDASIEEAKKAIEEDLVVLAEELGEEDSTKLKLQLGLDDEQELLDKYATTVNKIAKNIQKQQKAIAKQSDKINKKTKDTVDEYDDLADYSKEVKDFIAEQGLNTLDELALLQQCVDTTDSWAAAMQKFEMVHIATDFEEAIANLESNLTVVEEDINGINEAISASNSAMGLSAEQIENIAAAFEGLDGYNYDTLFESTASGVRLNAYELERLNNEYDKTQKAKYTETLDKMQEEYEDLCLAIVDTKDEQEQLNLIAKRNNLKEQIEQVQELASRYGGLTSAYADWQNAQDTADSYEMYDNIYSGIEEIDELYQRDLTGSDDFKNYMQQFYYGDLDEYLNNAGKSYQQFYEENAAMIQKYFTEDNTGSINFLNKLQEFGYAWKNEFGQWEIDGDVEEIAKSFGWATSTIDAQFKKLEAHEFKFQFVETEPLDKLKAKAEEVTDFIAGKFGEEYRFDFNTDSIDTIDGYISQLEALKNQSGLTTEEIEALNAQIEYWTAKKGELTKGVEFEFSLNATIAELELCQDKLKELGKISVDFNLNPSTIEDVEIEILKVQDLLEDFRTADGQIDITQEGAEETLAILANLMKTKIELGNPVVMNVDTSKVTGDISTAIQNIQIYQDAVNDLETIKQLNADYNLNLDTTDAQAQVDTALANIKGMDKTILANLGIDPTSQETMTKTISAITPEMMVKAGVNEEAILGYTPDNKDATVIYGVDRTAVDEFLNKNLDRTATVTYTYVATNNIPTSAAISGAQNVNGNANAQGNARSTLLQRGMAFAKGVWGAAKNGASLVGELGREIIVRGNRWFTVGDNGAEFTDVRKGDIIFNHKQTEEILANGHVTSGGGRGHMANASGNAYLEGNAYALVARGSLGGSPGRYTTTGSDITNNTSLNNDIAKTNESLLEDVKDAADSASDAVDEFLETMDWVEIKIDRLQRKIQDLDTIANSVYKNLTKRNNTLAEEFSRVTDEINLQQAAYNTYMAKANSINLSETYKQKVRDGKLQIEDITNEDLKELIDEYQEWYEKALDCKYAITDLKEQLGDISKAKFDNVQSEFDALIAKIEDTIELTEGGLDLVEARGQFASEQYFKALMSTEKENIAMIEKEYIALQKAYEEAMGSGTIEVGSEAYYEMQQQIRDVEKALQDAQLALIEYKNEMWEMDWSAFEYGQSLIEELTKESEFLIDLLSLNENDLFSKKSGKLTDEGMSVGGLHAVNYNTYMAQAEAYQKKVEEINKLLADDPTNTILIDQKNEYIAAQQEAIQAANDEKMAIHDLIEESYNRMLEILQELIDKRKEALQAERDLYSYEKNVREQTKQITDYQKQLASIAGDDSEEAKSRRQQLQTSLEQAQSDLEETEYDQWLSDQEKLMDDMYSQWESVLNERLDNIDGLLADMIDTTNENSETINNTITTAANDVGYQLTDGMSSIWNTTDSGIGKVVTDFSNNFTTTLTTTNATIQKIYDLINKNVKNADKDVTKNTKPASTVSSSSSSSGGSSSSNKTTPTTNKNKGWFFVYKKDSYPKNKLNVEQSIVDRLKYNNFDSSWSNMAAYYEGMGLGKRSSYTGSYKQNVAMLSWMKKNGYSQGGTIGKLIRSAGSDNGFILAQSGEEVLSKDKLRIADDMVTKLIDFRKIMPIIKPVQPIEKSTMGDVNLTLNLPNITNSDEFVDFLKSKKAQNVIQSYTTDLAVGKNSLNKYKYK